MTLIILKKSNNYQILIRKLPIILKLVTFLSKYINLINLYTPGLVEAIKTCPPCTIVIYG